MTRISVRVGDRQLFATMDDTSTARDFISLLPLDLTLEDYNRTEKVSHLPRKLATAGAPASYAAQTGDITYYAPFGTLAIFYRPFRAASGLVPMGAFDGAIDALVDNGSHQVRLELAE